MQMGADNSPEFHETLNSSNSIAENTQSIEALAMQSTVSTGLKPLELPENPDLPPPISLPPPPSLRGKLLYDGNSCICRGLWAISDSHHDVPDQTSEFEFKLVDAKDRSYPISGKYKGWFHLKTGPKHIKIEERDIYITFTKNESSDSYSIVGSGSNKFGTFSLSGSLQPEGTIQLYKDYQYKPIKQIKSTETPKKDSNSTPFSSLSSPRESSNRVRKTSSLIQGPEDPSPSPRPSPRTQASKQQQYPLTPSTPPPPPPMSPPPPTSRDRRLALQLQKCADLLKELSKNPHSIWFLEPVDYIKLGIPDYPSIISHPMDFRTIRENLEASSYDNIDAFAEHMRLVFRNAITYNQLRDNPVHIAAREISSRFEEKFRQMVAVLGQQTALMEEYSRGAGGGGRQGGGQRKSIGGASKARIPAYTSPVFRKPVPGPHTLDYLPPSLDSGTLGIIEMRKQMQEMQDELQALRSQMRHNEIKTNLESQREAAKNPLTLQEKQTLIAQIQELPEPKMNQAIDIIKSSLSSESRGVDSSEGEIEVSLDDLSTLTLRKLQAFIEDYYSKKRVYAPPASPRNTDIKPEPSTKRLKQDAEVLQSSSSTSIYSVQEVVRGEGHLEEEDSLLFSNDDLEGAEAIPTDNPDSLSQPILDADENHLGDL